MLGVVSETLQLCLQLGSEYISVGAVRGSGGFDGDVLPGMPSTLCASDMVPVCGFNIKQTRGVHHTCIEAPSDSRVPRECGGISRS